uniref:Uncharacterized protein n=2 Tax=Ditylum brightwellii TaxID=49249 RepID=A0A7S4SFD6_9STRA
MNSSSSKLKIMRVPCSKGDVFSTKLLSPNEKRRLMKFLQLALDYAHATSSQYSEQQQQEEAQKNSSTNATAESSTTSLQEEQVTSLNERQLNQGRSLARPQNKSISKNDMNILLQCIHDGMDFDTYLKTKQKLDDRLRKIVIHALSLGSVVADSDSSTSSRKYDTERGMNDLCRHLVSLGRYGGTAFLCPLYGSGELSQSFCRSSAVHGGVYLLRRPAKQILTTCKKENDDDVESVYGILLGGDSMDDNDGINSFGYGVVEDKVIHGRNIIAANDSLFLHQKKILEKSTARRILRRISVVRGKLIPSSSGEQKNDISNGHDDENSQEQRYIIVMTPQTGTLKNESVIHGLAIDDSVFVSPTSSGAEDVYTVLHLTTSIECCTEEGKVVFDDAVLDQAVASLIESRQGSSDTVMEELYHVSFSYPDLDSDNKEEENEKIEAEAKIDFIIPKGLHICHRPGQSITVDAAFREAERIFHDICPGAEFLARSEDIDKAVQERVGNNRVGDDDEGMMLESAMHMIGSVDDEQES